MELFGDQCEASTVKEETQILKSELCSTHTLCVSGGAQHSPAECSVDEVKLESIYMFLASRIHSIASLHQFFFTFWI